MPKNKHKSDTAPPFALGAPERPTGLSRAERNAWNKVVAELLAARKLAQSDGDLLRELLQARADQYKGAGARRESGRKRAAEIQSKFEARAPFPAVPTTAENDTSPTTPSLEQFLGDVRNERTTFQNRLVPGQTVCLDVAAPYEWPEDDPAAVARLYCQQITQGAIPACDLLRRSCARHLSDLESAHTRGLFFDPIAARNIARWYKDFCALKLEPWETWIVTSLFAWKKPSGARRFQDAWISMAKKNGKTTVASGIGLFGLVADGEPFAEVYSAATKKDQARLIYRDAVRAVHGNPELKAVIKEFTATNISALKILDTDSSFEPLSSETKSMDGLRPHFILADEIHEWESREAWDKLSKGNVSRPQPLVFAITTAGESENCFAHNKHSLATKILTGVFLDDTTFVAVYELDKDDDFRDERNWIKANPNLGVSLQPEALRKILAEAEADPSGQTAFQRYHGNRWVSFRAGRSIPAAKWDKCRGADYLPDHNPLELRRQFLEDNFLEKCWGGLDLGLISDLSCYVLLFPLSDRVAVVPFFWMPEFALFEKEKSWEVPLSTWAREGWIKLIEGDMCDPRIVREDIGDLCQNGPGKIQSISYDPWQARVLMAELAESRVCECREVPQKPGELTTPAREFKQAIWNKTLWHLNNPVLRWMAGNVVLEEDDKHGGLMPKKISPKEKIDGVQSIITAWHGYLAAPKVSTWDGNIKLW
ncbi:MAG TPA: terminase large subunit [Candidatus Acidoferrales bacterium]|nr:terminase large subunit [Candidatus Acidoferrales bacterium]